MDRKVRFTLSILVIFVFFSLPNAWAHKIDTHVWIAQQVLNDVITDGSLSFPGFTEEFSIDPVLRSDLALCQDEYRMGAIGPDAFPDMVGGQMTTHPGVPGDNSRWQTNDWLRHVLQLGSAYGGCARAFAFGYLTHAASDVFAHTYVNIYAGDIFDIGDGLEEELRHMALEAFVSEHMPPIVDNSGTVHEPAGVINVPAEFIAKTLIMNPLVADEYRAVSQTQYLAAMYDLWAKLNELIKQTEALTENVANEISDIEVDLIPSGIIPLVNPLCIPIPFVTDCVEWVGVDWGSVSLDPIYDVICLNCDDYDACGIKNVWPCEHFNACPLIPTNPAGCTTHSILENSGKLIADSITLPIRQWRDAIEQAIIEYAKTQEEIAKEIMRGDEGDPMGAYVRWLTCWGPAFSGLIPKVVSGSCAIAQDALHSLTDGISSFRSEVSRLTGDLGWALDPLQKINEEVTPALFEELLDGLDALATDGSLLDSLILMRRKKHNDGTLNEEFAINSSEKDLLVISDVAARVRAEMEIDPSTDTWSTAYPVIHNSIVLSKLLLLPPQEVNRMVVLSGVSSTAYGPMLYSPIFWQGSNSFSPLLGMARSIDGSHQWQEYAPPYARDCAPDEHLIDCIARDENFPEERKYGYGFSDPDSNPAGGFRLWQDCGVRRNLFNTLFVGPIAPGLETAGELGFSELLPMDHPLRGSGDNPFPLSPASESVDTVPPVPDKSTLEAVYTACNVSAKVSPPTATDACEGMFFGQTADSLSYGSVGEYQIVWSYTDETGNTSQQVQSLMVEDHNPPELTTPLPETLEQTNHDGTPFTLEAASATDDCEGEVTISDDAPEVYPLGETVVTFTAVDSSGNSTSKSVKVAVVDTTDPVFEFIPADVTLEQTSFDGAPFDLGDAQVSDICDLAPDVTDNRMAIYPLGITEVEFTATDDSGNEAKASTWITVEDTNPPIIGEVASSKRYLWPPNHKMVPVKIEVEVSDVCDADPVCRVTRIESNQPVNANADGDTELDWEITGYLRVRLLAERAGNDFDEPRIYTIFTECSDASGNVSDEASLTVIVPVEIEDIVD